METLDILGSVCPQYVEFPAKSELHDWVLCLSLRFHAERAIDIITHILPEDHLLLASSKRVKGKAGKVESSIMLLCVWLAACNKVPWKNNLKLVLC